MGEIITAFISEHYFFVTVCLFIVGACVGSFLNVCIVRMPEEMSVITPRSRCPRCGHPIPWYDNIPILSYIVLGGQCRFCAERISPQYLIIEILTGYLFVEFFVLFGTTVLYVAYLYLACSLLVATLVDIKFQIIPDEINYIGMAVGLVLSAAFPALHQETLWYKGLTYAFLGLLVGGGSIYAIGIFGNIVFRKESMGGGDVKLMAMIGAFLGWKFVLLTFFIAPFLGSVMGLYIKFVKKGEIIPYGPFLSAAAFVALFGGERILSLLLGS